MPPGTPQPNVQTNITNLPFSVRVWLLVILTGIGAGIGGGLLMRLLHAVQQLAFGYDSGTFLDGVQQTSVTRRMLVLGCAGLVTAIGRWLFQRATGGHAGELSERIWFHSGRLPTATTLGRAALSIVIVGMGGAVGREGALKQTGAAIAARLASWTRLSAAQTRFLAAVGAGAGMAAAYNVPCGGALFALEVLLGGIGLRLVVPALAASAIATAVSWTFLPNRPTYAVGDYTLTLPQLGWALLSGPLFGLATVLFVRVIAWADARKPHGWRMLLAPVVVFGLLGAASVVYPQLLGNGKDAVQLAFASQLDLDLLLALPALRMLATASCLGSGAPGGLFTPTLTYGSLLGGLLGYACHIIWPEAPLSSYAMIGAGAVLATATQGPVSAVVLLIELTWHIDPLIVPLLIAIGGATAVARRLEPRSVYTARIRMGEAAAQRPPGDEVGFGDLITQNYDVVSAATRYTELARRLLESSERGGRLYVVDERGRLLGEITLSNASCAMDRSIPLETSAAADLATPVPAVKSSDSRAGVLRQLMDSGAVQMPVIDPLSGEFVGVVGLPAHGSHS